MAKSSVQSAKAELARAKVNLTLHVLGQRADGFHLLDSLVVFPQIGDRLAICTADELQLDIDGPFARELLGTKETNLVLKAVRLFETASGTDLPPLHVTLTKRLPVASGIGGGSSDAATAIRLLEDISGIYLADSDRHDLALSLGSDVPVCLWTDPQFMRGTGEDTSPGPELPECGMILVNPKLALETPSVFKNLANKTNPKMPPCPDQFENLDMLVEFLLSCRNDLQEPAITCCPEIDSVLSALNADSRIAFSRMSGSGATCFGLCDKKLARDIERDFRGDHPDWWIASGPLV